VPKQPANTTATAWLSLVTSSIPVEGKSTVSSNLALTLALSGSRVLLIDADLRRAGLDQIFDVPNDLGFADVLEQRASASYLIQPTKTPDLWLLPAGSATMNPGELFLAPSCDTFFAKIRSQYHYVIFDSPWSWPPTTLPTWPRRSMPPSLSCGPITPAPATPARPSSNSASARPLPAFMINRAEPRACGCSRGSRRLDTKWPETGEPQAARQT
jgi:hypothetical protein